MTTSTECICPHCGDAYMDPWDIGDGRDGDHEVTCDECRKTYKMVRKTEVWHTTSKLPRTKRACAAGSERGE